MKTNLFLFYGQRAKKKLERGVSCCKSQYMIAEGNLTASSQCFFSKNLKVKFKFYSVRKMKGLGMRGCWDTDKYWCATAERRMLMSSYWGTATDAGCRLTAADERLLLLDRHWKAATDGTLQMHGWWWKAADSRPLMNVFWLIAAACQATQIRTSSKQPILFPRLFIRSGSDFIKVPLHWWDTFSL